MQPFTLDDLDKKILAYLQEDGRMTFVTLASHLGVSEGTIRKRVKRLEDAGVLRTMGVTDPLKMGLDTVAFIWFKVGRLHLDGVIAALTELEEVRYLVVTTGGYDLVAMVVLPNRTQLVQLLNDKLSQIEGIISTETSIVLQIHKQIHEWAPFKDYVETEASHG
ncbi:MAG: Lrp/AsnC family transcriptional regulator [Limnochordia bacterium]|jgi:Lrp/AsnC family transcriptional regulator for asnA, asnC and gidA